MCGILCAGLSEGTTNVGLLNCSGFTYLYGNLNQVHSTDLYIYIYILVLLGEVSSKTAVLYIEDVKWCICVYAGCVSVRV